MSYVRSSYYWPETRIRRRGQAGYKSVKMKLFLKGISAYLVIVFFFSLAYVWTRVQVLKTGYRLRALEVQQEELKETNRSLLVETATLRSPQRLEQIARMQDLKRPQENQVVYIKKKQVPLLFEAAKR